MKKILAFVTAFVCFMCSCGDRKDKVLTMEDKVFVKEFPCEIDLVERQDVSIDEIGVNAVKFVDSLMFIGHGGCWSVYDVRNFTKYGNVLKTGQGPGEFNFVPRCSSAAFVNESDSLVAYIPDKNNGAINKFNVTDFIRTGKEHVGKYLRSQYLTNDVWDVIPCNGERFLLSVPIHDFSGFKRCILEGDSLVDLNQTKPMEKILVDESNDINLLARVTRYNNVADKFVEGLLFLNQINIFSGDGKWGKTICVGNELDGVDEIESQFRFDRINAYTTVTAWDCGFGAAYSGVTEKTRQLGTGHSSVLQIFDWDGNPLCLVKVPHSTMAFDIDFVNKLLFIVTEDDEIKIYDASQCIKELDGNRHFSLRRVSRKQ